MIYAQNGLAGPVSDLAWVEQLAQFLPRQLRRGGEPA
jgi:hypothetical protein